MTNLKKEIIAVFEANGNEENAAAMEKYMKDLYPYLGIKSPVGNEISKPFFQASKKLFVDEIIQLVKQLWELPHREYQYLAIEILRKNWKKFTPEHLPFFQELVLSKPWWDTVDSLSTNVVGKNLITYPENRKIMDGWMMHDSLWVRRCAVLHQLKYKNETDQKQLFKYCKMGMHEKDFFMRKAIGWALRQHAKLNPDEVKNFVNEHDEELSNLSKREALKHFS